MEQSEIVNQLTRTNFCFARGFIGIPPTPTHLTFKIHLYRACRSIIQNFKKSLYVNFVPFVKQSEIVSQLTRTNFCFARGSNKHPTNTLPFKIKNLQFIISPLGFFHPQTQQNIYYPTLDLRFVLKRPVSP
jgi:hypothetical protein